MLFGPSKMTEILRIKDKKMNLCKKFPGKKVSGKKTAGNKNFGKKVWIFSSPWKKCHWIPGTFFPKIVWGLPITSQEIRFHEKSPEENKSEEKKPRSPKSQEIVSVCGKKS